MDTKYASREIEAAAAIREGIAKLTDDEDAIRDTLEGETDLKGVIERLVASVQVDDALSEGLGSLADSLNMRRSRFDARVEHKRALIHQAMEIAGWPKLELPSVTLSLAKGRPGTRIINEADIPAEFWKAGEPTLDKKALGEALKAGPVPGAELSNPMPTLMIRIT